MRQNFSLFERQYLYSTAVDPSSGDFEVILEKAPEDNTQGGTVVAISYIGRPHSAPAAMENNRTRLDF